jgi:uncharacterized protein YdcH (DUF465 family)
MSTEYQIKHLEEQHHALNKSINGMESTSVFEDATMEVLKKQRLHLKDEIVKIQHKIAHELGTQEKH